MPDARPILCRQIETRDRDDIVALLTQGFRGQRDRAFWARAIERLAAHDTPPGLPRYGYLLESGSAVVGVILLIFTLLNDGDTPTLRCNLSSWYVADPFTMYGPLLISRALRHREATYVNLTAVPRTFPILQAHGFIRYCEGRFVAVPLLSRGVAGVTITPFAADMRAGNGLSEADIDLLRTHAADGCISLVGASGAHRYPFVIAPRRKHAVLGYGLLAYCRDIAAFPQFARPIGLFLATRGIALLAIDANGPLDGLVGRYTANKPKYYRGQVRPRPADLAYSERTMFGS